MKITSRTYPSKKGEITVIRIESSNGSYVELSSLGAGVVAVGVPDANGVVDNVALSYANPADYIYDGPCLGKVPGRYANRIAAGKFEIDGKSFQLAINNGPNALHGGPEGFQNQIWEHELTTNGVRFTYRAKDGEECYPGNLIATATYRWNDNYSLELELEAETDQATIVNLTNHSYWNLRGADSGSVLDHLMSMKCSHYLPTDDTLIPSGEIADVEGTPMDFRTEKALGKEINQDFPALKAGKGYDASWVVDNAEKGKLIEDIVTISDPVSHRVIKISSTQPAAHVYTGNWLEGSPLNHSGNTYHDYEGVAVEMQGMPDAPNHANFPSQLLRPGEKYHQLIRFAFSCK